MGFSLEAPVTSQSRGTWGAEAWAVVGLLPGTMTPMRKRSGILTAKVWGHPRRRIKHAASKRDYDL